jgi:DME family drug/metabolite transporter
VPRNRHPRRACLETVIPVSRLAACVRREPAGLFMAVVAFSAWGLLTPIGKILLAELEPMTLNALRMLIATALLALYVPPSVWKVGLQYLRRKDIVLLALLGGGLDFTVYLYALTRVDATFATLGFYTAPLWTALLARARLGEKLGVAFVPAIVLLFAGGWLAMFGGLRPDAAGFDVWGMTLAVLAGLGWAVYAVGLRAVAPDLRLRPLMVCSFIVSTVYFVVLALIIEGPGDVTAITKPTWGWLILHAALPTTLAMLLFNGSLQRAPAGHVNILVGVELAATALFAWLLLGDTFTPIQITGLGVALASVSWYLWTRIRARVPRVPPTPA